MRVPPAVILVGTGVALVLAVPVTRSGAQTATPAAPPAFAVCKACHSVARGAPSGIGPNLHGTFGGPAGARAGYAYSPAMKAKKLTWDRATLDAYIANPRALVPGTKMMSPPVTDAAKRKAIIDYLAALK